MKRTHQPTRALLLLCLSVFLMNSAQAQHPELSDEVRSQEFSLSKKSLALDGYDPVAYFQGDPKKGSKGISLNHAGVHYRFSSAENLDRFKENPAQFEPQYGGWCAWAMYDDGGRTEANPESFKIVDEKLYLFYDGLWGDTLKLWNNERAKNPETALITTADRYWAAQLPLARHYKLREDVASATSLQSL